MKLRDHPLMSYRGVPNWPPQWVRAKRGDVRLTRGEIGILTYVIYNPRLSGKCFLQIDYQGENYLGTLLFDDKPFCAQVGKILARNLLRPISAIGDLDLSHLL